MRSWRIALLTRVGILIASLQMPMQGVKVIVVASIIASTGAARADELAFGDVVNRLGVSVLAGDGWSARYTGDRIASRSLSGGVMADIALGNDNLSMVSSLGLLYDAGTTPDAMMEPQDALWMLDFGLGIEAAPYAFVNRDDLEVRLHLGVRASVVRRNGCDRCDELEEPGSGVLGVGSVGIVAWWCRNRDRGVGIDAVFMGGKLGSLSSGVSTADLSPPTWLVRITWSPYRGHRATTSDQ
jgi:hypothetical protein